MGIADIDITGPAMRDAGITRNTAEMIAEIARAEIREATSRGVDLTEDVLTELRRPFAPEAVKWKIQVELKNAAIIVAHLDARLVVERLNKVAGFGWRDEYRPMGTGWMWCDLTVHGVTRTDCGTGTGPQAAKAMVSDSLKRAAVKFGIGVSIYAMAAVQLKRGSEPNELRYITKRKKKKDGSGWEDAEIPMLDKKTMVWLQGAYARWLEDGSGRVFGEPLEHGDEAGAPGLEGGVDEDEPEVAEGVDEQVVELEDERAEELKQSAKDAFGTLRERGEMLPGEFQQRLRVAAGSHEALEALVDELVGRATKPPESS